LLKIKIALDPTPFRLLSASRRYEGSHCFELQGEEFKGAELFDLGEESPYYTRRSNSSRRRRPVIFQAQ